MSFILNWISTAIAIWFATAIISGISVDGSWTTYLWVAIVFGLINATLGLVLRIVTFPLSVITLGLFLIVINALMLKLTASLVGSLTIETFWSALAASVIISLASSLINSIFSAGRKAASA